MFIDDEFWNQFAADRGPEGSLFWAAAPVLLALTLPALVLLGAIAIEWVRIGRTRG